MPKRKREPSEYDEIPFPPLPMEYGDSSGNASIKRKRQGCVFVLMGMLAFLVFGLIGLRIYQYPTALQSVSATPTFLPDDDQPVRVDSGLVFAEYAVNGQQTGVYDLDGQEINTVANDIPVYLPASSSEYPLENLNVIAYPEGAFYDSSSGQLIVFGPPAQVDLSTSRDDFLTALRAVYAGQAPGVSIDPTGSETSQNVRYIGQTENTHFGWVMFEADRRMKTLSMGKDNISGVSVTSSVPGFANMFDLELQLGNQNQSDVRRRFWFTVQNVEIEESPDGQSMAISALSLQVQTEYLDSNWKTLPSQFSDPVGQAFSAHLTDHYDEYVDEFPVFGDLKEIARWTALANWLKQADLPIQPELWLADLPTLYSAAPLTTPAITVTRTSEQSNFIQTLTLWGGVNLEMNPVIRPAREATLGRIKEIANAVKARTGISSLELAGKGISYALVSSSQLEQDGPCILELPMPLAPPLKYNSDGWTFLIPHLSREGAAQTVFFLFNDPRQPQSVLLSYYGRDVKTGADIFANESHGLRLAVYLDGYQLLFGEFRANEEFSFLENDFMLFDLQGNVLQDMKTGSNYNYVDGVLTSIQQGGQKIKITMARDGYIQQLKSADKEIDFVYDNRLLTTLHDANNVTIRKFTYDDSGRLVRESVANGKTEKVLRYDAMGRLFYQVENGRPFMYDWREEGVLTRISGEALLPWQNASIKDLEDLKVMLRLKRDGVAEQMLFVRQLDDNLLVMVNDQSYTLPAYMLQNPSALRKKLKGILVHDQPGQIALISSSDIQGVAFQTIYQNAIPLIAETLDENRIRINVNILRNPRGFDLANLNVINGVPQPEDAGAAGSRPELWYVESDNKDSKTWKTAFDDLLVRFMFGSSLQSPANQQVEKSLSEDRLVLIIVAHSDGRDVYLPDGTKFNPDNLSQEDKARIAQQKPLVILLSCDTAASLDGDVSLAQKLLEAGPSAVIAPNGTLNVSDAYSILKSFLERSRAESDSLHAFFKAIKDIYPDSLIPNDDGLDHFFEFHVHIVIPNV